MTTNGRFASSPANGGETKGGGNHLLIVGTGFAGLGMAIRLKQRGIHSFTVLEQEGDVGGTWRDNSYPGAACDVESHLYSFSFEPHAGWSHMFARQTEIWEYLRRCVDKYNLRSHIRFGAKVKGASFDKQTGLWSVALANGETLEARAIVSGCGGLSRPSVPNIPGLDGFTGHAFHSARWDHNYSLEGRRVAVVGTGASSVQIVPEIAKVAKHLYVFQRTPPWIVPRPDRLIEVSEKELFARFRVTQEFVRRRIFLKRELATFGFTAAPQLLRLGEFFARRHLHGSVSDPELRRKLTPDYRLGCKRILLSNDYYSTLTRPNVSLVTEAVEQVRGSAIVGKSGTSAEVDALILCTGFQASDDCAPFDIRGVDGQSLIEEWAPGAQAYVGTVVSGFPNLFVIVGPNTGLGSNSMVLMIESQIDFILQAVEMLHSNNVKYLDVLPDVQRNYNEHIQKRLANTVWNSGCKSWYQTASGKNTTLWPGTTTEFRRRARFNPLDFKIVTEAGSPLKNAAHHSILPAFLRP